MDRSRRPSMTSSRTVHRGLQQQGHRRELPTAVRTELNTITQLWPFAGPTTMNDRVPLDQVRDDQRQHLQRALGTGRDLTVHATVPQVHEPADDGAKQDSWFRDARFGVSKRNDDEASSACLTPPHFCDEPVDTWKCGARQQRNLIGKQFLPSGPCAGLRWDDVALLFWGRLDDGRA